jgi:hypothetical protein
MAKFLEIRGATQSGRQGLGYGSEKWIWWSKASAREKRQLTLDVKQKTSNTTQLCSRGNKDNGQHGKTPCSDPSRGTMYGIWHHFD